MGVFTCSVKSLISSTSALVFDLVQSLRHCTCIWSNFLLNNMVHKAFNFCPNNPLPFHSNSHERKHCIFNIQNSAPAFLNSEHLKVATSVFVVFFLFLCWRETVQELRNSANWKALHVWFVAAIPVLESVQTEDGALLRKGHMQAEECLVSHKHTSYYTHIVASSQRLMY